MRKNLLMALPVLLMALTLAACDSGDPARHCDREPRAMAPRPRFPGRSIPEYPPSMSPPPSAGRPAPDRSPPTGMAVNAFATGLDHPRWLYVLPNGDVLVAETNAPPKPDDGKGIKGWIAKQCAEEGRRRRAERQPHHAAARRRRRRRRRDAKRSSSSGLNSPFGMALVGDDLYVADTDAILRFPYHDGETEITAPGVKLTDLPAGTHQPPLDQEPRRQPRRQQALRDGRLQQQCRRERHRRPRRAAPRSGSRSRQRRKRVFASGLRNPNGIGLAAGDRRAVGRRSTSATNSATTWCPTT